MLEGQVKKKIERTKWLLKELNIHRETDANITKEESVPISDFKIKDETSEAD